MKWVFWIEYSNFYGKRKILSLYQTSLWCNPYFSWSMHMVTNKNGNYQVLRLVFFQANLLEIMLQEKCWIGKFSIIFQSEWTKGNNTNTTMGLKIHQINTIFDERNENSSESRIHNPGVLNYNVLDAFSSKS